MPVVRYKRLVNEEPSPDVSLKDDQEEKIDEESSAPVEWAVSIILIVIFLALMVIGIGDAGYVN